MRTFVGATVMVVGMMVGVRVSAGQMVDPSTGMMVDAATDPMDFTAIMSGQPTNVGLEAALSANAQARAEMNANVASAAASDDAATSAGGDVVVAPRLPVTPKPVMTPGGGTFKGSVAVTLADSDAAAVVFYTTDGKRPTTSSTRYAGPVVVTASGKTTKIKVQALAFDVNKQPSGVVAKTFKVRS